MVNRSSRWSMPILALVLCLGLLAISVPARAEATGRTFPETGKTASGAMYEYWITHGGVPLLGYPITDRFEEASSIDGKTYPVQYFQRAELELHPENSAPYAVMPSLLGDMAYNTKYPGGAPNQQASTENPVKFAQTGATLGGAFRDYWQTHGGTAQFGYPISNEFLERSPLDGRIYPVQYFERAEFEMHPASQPNGGLLGDRLALRDQTAQPGTVLLSQLGTSQLQSQYPNGAPAARPAPVPTPRPGCASNLEPGKWSGPVEERMTMEGEGYNGSGVISGTTTLNVVCNGAFTGTTTVSKFSAKGGKGALTLATCSLTENPVADYTGKQEVRPDGLHLLVSGGTFTKGVVSCKIPFQPARVEQLTGRQIDATDIKVESASPGRIAGSEWLAGAVNSVILKQVYSINPNAKIDVASTGAWVLNLQK